MSILCRCGVAISRCGVVKEEKVFVFVLAKRGLFSNANGYSSMEFYGFDERMNPIVDDVDWKAPTISDSRALPFTGLNSCPRSCSLTSYQGKVYLVGGAVISDHLVNRLLLRQQYDLDLFIACESGKDIIFDDLDSIFQGEFSSHKFHSLPEKTFKYILSPSSNRVACFDTQKSLLHNKPNDRLVVDFGELDVDINFYPIKFFNMYESTHWQNFPPLNKSREDCTLLHVQGRLFAVGGIPVNDDGVAQHHASVSLIEELTKKGTWCLLNTINTNDFINPGFLVAAAIDSYNGIIIGSNGYFYFFAIQTGELLPLGIECPDVFILGCFGRPGFIVDELASWDDMVVVWHDRSGTFLRGLRLGDKHHVFIDLELHNLLVNPDEDHICSTQVIGLPKGIFCLIYVGQDASTFIDDEGVDHYLVDYILVKFRICSSKTTIYPDGSVDLQTLVVSRCKCYAPRDMALYGAFAMDVSFPLKKNMSLSSTEDIRAGLGTILQL